MDKNDKIVETRTFYSVWNTLPEGKSLDDIHEYEQYYYNEPIRTWPAHQKGEAECFVENTNKVRARVDNKDRKPPVILKERTVYYGEWRVSPGQVNNEQLALF